MSSKIDWVMKVAVISTAHHPQGWEPDHWILHFKTDDPRDGVIVYIEDLMEPPKWLAELAHTLATEGFGWVRFCLDANVIEGLATFEWE